MLKIILNQKEILLHSPISLNEILRLYYPAIMHFSVAINMQFIPREQYEKTFPCTGDIIDIISAMQGG